MRRHGGAAVETGAKTQVRAPGVADKDPLANSPAKWQPARCVATDARPGDTPRATPRCTSCRSGLTNTNTRPADRSLHIRVHLWWVSRWIRRLLVVTGARCPLTKPVVAVVELQAATEPHCSPEACKPGGICVCVGISRADPGVRGRAGARAAGASYARSRSGYIYIYFSSEAGRRETEEQPFQDRLELHF
jgi:hypothetical protein